MTYIEFFDNNVTENICASLVKAPDKVILIGSSRKVLDRHVERYRELFLSHGHDVEFVAKSVNKNDMKGVVATLSEIIETNDDCVIDLTGGEDVYLVAIGIVSERYKHKNIQMHRFNLANGTIIDCDGDNNVLEETESPKLTVREGVRVYGGDVVYGAVDEDATYEWILDEEFKNDIRAMWSVCKRNVKAWNTQISILGTIEKIGTVEELSSVVSVKSIKEQLAKSDYGFFVDFGVLGPLRQMGLLDYMSTPEVFGVTYKNEQVKRCLTKAGQALEMIIYITAKEVTEKNGEPTYNDVMNGVRIDWDGEIHSDVNAHEVENEIDVIMMRGIVPVFVSCKNGRVDMNELYKLDSVAERFGGRYARKIFVATALEFAGDFSEYFRQRAEEMNICLIDDVQKMDEKELYKTVRSFWSRS